MDAKWVNSEAAGSGEEARMGFAQRLIGSCFEPQKTFEDVGRKGSWLGVFLLVSALISAAGYLVATRLDHESLMRKSLAMNPLTKNMSEEQIQQIVSRPMSPFQKYSGAMFAPVGVLVAYLVTAGVLLLVFVLMGVAISYKRALSVTVWGMGPPAVVLMILAIVSILVRDPDSLDVNVANNVVANPAVLASQEDHPVLHSFLSSIDLFSFWTIYLLSVGFAAVSGRKLSQGRAAVGVMIPWGIYVLGKAGVVALMS